ncbi:DUF3147 family protein [Streptacidiphilus neutrinimicus]|uniref:DUF3147 family protein n=1 Tax=Streptacidiphilus neutrinimicus TaxID=105420 RepID=UPI000694AD4C|nr:DUF3147 family protein [Streptacidiphilus neutrinimicus]
MTHPSEDLDRIRLDPSAAGKVKPRDMGLRFAFGAAVSALAALIAYGTGAKTGGMFLAFPAIALASLTLVADNEVLRRARDDARGAVFGTLGLLAFALTGWQLLPCTSAWSALTAATAAWSVVSGLAYLVARMTSHGGDERPPPGQENP